MPAAVWAHAHRRQLGRVGLSYSGVLSPACVQDFLVSWWLLGKKPCFEVSLAHVYPCCILVGVLRDLQEAPHTALLAPLASNVAATRGLWGS